jgi:hypothetical protein
MAFPAKPKATNLSIIAKKTKVIKDFLVEHWNLEIDSMPNKRKFQML